MAVALARRLERPLLLEGAPGVGKTEVAKAVAEVLAARLIRLQCYEGLDANAAIYEWDYRRQLLAIRLQEAEGRPRAELEQQLFSETFLLRRPLLEAISQEVPPVLLIDEIDRADEEFEAYLLEVLSDFQVTIPEIGTISATSRPLVILTSNGSRALSDALRRRCLYAYLDYPDETREVAIIAARLPDIDRTLCRQAVQFVQALRAEDLEKTPGIAETLDWVRALFALGIGDLAQDPEALQASLLCLLKTEPDIKATTPEVTARLLGRVA
ncbi:MAG: MoxR family ATPase [Pseudomonadota bacterium]